MFPTGEDYEVSQVSGLIAYVGYDSLKSKFDDLCVKGWLLILRRKICYRDHL